MTNIDAMKDKIAKLGKKQKLSNLIKLANDDNEEIRAAVAESMSQISTYDCGMALIPLLRDSSPLVRAAAARSAAEIKAKHCEEYVKKLAFADLDPMVRQAATEAFNKLRDRVV